MMAVPPPSLRPFAEIEREATAAKVAQIVAGVEAGMTLRQVARAVGVAPSTITRVAQLAGLRITRTLTLPC